MQGMFADCSNLESIDLSGFDLSGLDDSAVISYGFSGEPADSKILAGCNRLETISLAAGQDFTNSGLRDAIWQDENGKTYSIAKELLHDNAGRSNGNMTYTANNLY